MGVAVQRSGATVAFRFAAYCASGLVVVVVFDCDMVPLNGLHSTSELENLINKYLTPAEQQLLLEIRRRKTELLHEIQQLKDEIAEVTAEMESMDNGEESKNVARAKQLSLGRKKFNM